MNTKSLIRTFETEYLRTNGLPAVVTVAGKWFKINNEKGVDINKFKAMLSALQQKPTVFDRVEKVNGKDTMIRAYEHVVKNMMSGEDCVEDRNTPHYCSVASESYWSM